MGDTTGDDQGLTSTAADSVSIGGTDVPYWAFGVAGGGIALVVALIISYVCCIRKNKQGLSLDEPSFGSPQGAPKGSPTGMVEKILTPRITAGNSQDDEM